MFKTIVSNLLSIHKPRINENDIIVKIKISRKMKSNQKKSVWWSEVDWHVFKLPNRNQSVIIDDIKIEAEIME